MTILHMNESANKLNTAFYSVTCHAPETDCQTINSKLLNNGVLYIYIYIYRIFLYLCLGIILRIMQGIILGIIIFRELWWNYTGKMSSGKNCAKKKNTMQEKLFWKKTALVSVWAINWISYWNKKKWKLESV